MSIHLSVCPSPQGHWEAGSRWPWGGPHRHKCRLKEIQIPPVFYRTLSPLVPFGAAAQKGWKKKEREQGRSRAVKTDWVTDRQTDKHWPTDKLTNKLKNRLTERLTNRLINRQIDAHSFQRLNDMNRNKTAFSWVFAGFLIYSYKRPQFRSQ